MNGAFVLIGLGSVLAGLLLAARRLAHRPERRERIDVDLVLEEKYPNRRAADRTPVPAAAAVTAGGPAPVAPEPVPVAPAPEPVPVAPAAEPVPVAPAPEPVPVAPAAEAVAPAPAVRVASPGPSPGWPEPAAPAAWIPPPVLDGPPWVPIPGEPGDAGLVGPPRRPARLAETPEGPSLVASPYDALRRRRDRVAAQAAAAFAEVHRLRTESLRRASQAEHNAQLATTARVRATRMAHEARRYEERGRRRSVAVPDADDAFHDVHRFRVEALRRAHEAEHGAEAVARARERATRLLGEQRRLEAEMSRLRRGGVPDESLGSGRSRPMRP